MSLESFHENATLRKEHLKLCNNYMVMLRTMYNLLYSLTLVKGGKAGRKFHFFG